LVAWALTLCSGVLCAGSAQAQITKIAKIGNDDGRTLFVNAEPPVMMKIAPRRNSIFLPAETSITGRVHPSMTWTATARKKLVREAAERHRIDPALIRAVIETESNWNSARYRAKAP